jgi:hypothetical protein
MGRGRAMNNSPPKAPKGYIAIKRFGKWEFIKKEFKPAPFGKGKRVVK